MYASERPEGVTVRLNTCHPPIYYHDHMNYHINDHIHDDDHMIMNIYYHDDQDGLPANSHHDKNPPWWEFVSNEYGGNMPVTKSHH